MTAIARADLATGDIISVDGYGGFAKVLHIEQDGYTPPRKDHPPAPKYIVTVHWGPNNPTVGRAKAGSPVEVFPLGRLRPAHDSHVEQAAADREAAIDTMDKAALLARLAELNGTLQAQGA